VRHKKEWFAGFRFHHAHLFQFILFKLVPLREPSKQERK